MATLRDVAQLVGVSQTTVSRILNKDETISVTPEVRLRIFQAASQLNYVPPRQRKAAKAKKKLMIGVADWQIIRPDRPNVRLHSLALMSQVLNDKYEVEFTRLVYGKPQAVDGIIAFGVFRPEKLHFCTVCLLRLCLLILNREIMKMIRYRWTTEGDWKIWFLTFWNRNSIPVLAISEGFMKTGRSISELVEKDFRA